MLGIWNALHCHSFEGAEASLKPCHCDASNLTKASGRKQESVSSAFANSTYPWQPCKPVVALCFNPNFMLHLKWQVFPQGGIYVTLTRVCFNVRGSAAFHAWYYLPSLLNPWDRMVSYGWEDTEWFVSLVFCCWLCQDRLNDLKSLHHTMHPILHL